MTGKWMFHCDGTEEAREVASRDRDQDGSRRVIFARKQVTSCRPAKPVCSAAMRSRDRSTVCALDDAADQATKERPPQVEGCVKPIEPAGCNASVSIERWLG